MSARPRGASITVSIDVSNSGKISANAVRRSFIGRGYNVVDGSICSPIFKDLKVNYVDGLGRLPEKHIFFKNFEEYEQEQAKKVGVNFHQGMFTLCPRDCSTVPYLCTVDKISNYHIFSFEIAEDLYHLQLMNPKETSLNEALLQEEEWIKGHPFTVDTRQQYYSIIQMLGTHFVQSVTFGAKAEMCWSLRPCSSGSDTITRLTKVEQLKKLFMSATEEWKKNNFSCSTPKQVPKHCTVSMKTTENFNSLGEKKIKNAKAVGFRLEEVSELFSEPAKTQMRLAIQGFIEEMSPVRTPSNLVDGTLVGIFSIDSGTWVEVANNGFLKVSNNPKPQLEHQLAIRIKGHKLALKSVKYKSKYLSKAMTKNIFHFHRLQFMGPHESFEISGDYILCCANISQPTYIYSGKENELFHDGSDKKKSRLCILNTEARGETRYSEDFGEEPEYAEDSVVFEVHHPKELEESHKIPFFSKDTPKANSTSSLFIKDTIYLPDIDQLTRCIAIKLHQLIKDGHSKKNPHYLDIFDESKHPLSKNVPPLDQMKVPSVETIYHFINTIFKVEKLSPEPAIMFMVYTTRVLEKTKLTLHASNWRRLTLTAIILASKVWEDQSVWNVDFIELFPSISVRDLNKLEQHMLNHLNFNVTIKPSEYVKVFFELRNEGGREVEKRSLSLKPLDQKALKKLEVRTASSEEEYLQANLVKSATVADLGKHNPGKSSKKTGFGILS